MKRIAIKGKLIDAVESGTSPAGKDWANWQLQVKEKLFFCCAFDGVAASIKLVQLGGEIECIGYFKTPSDEETRNLVVNKLNCRTNQGTSLHDLCLKTYGSEEELRKHQEQQRLEMERLGRIRTTETRDGKTIHRWEEKALCFERGNTWYPKIEYAMDVLGAKHVAERLHAVASLELHAVDRDKEHRPTRPLFQLPSNEIREMIQLLFSDAKAKEQLCYTTS